MDTRVYCWVYKNSLPSFIAIKSSTLDKDSINVPFDKCQSTNHSLKVFRGGYSKAKAQNYMNLEELGMMEGPNLFILIEV